VRLALWTGPAVGSISDHQRGRNDTAATGRMRSEGTMSKDVGHWIGGGVVSGTSGRYGDIFNPSVVATS
jgi:hypothetical protein